MNSLRFRKYPALAPIGFLERVADTLRTSDDIVKEPLPGHMNRLMQKLDRVPHPGENDDPRVKGRGKTFGSARCC